MPEFHEGQTYRLVSTDSLGPLPCDVTIICELRDHGREEEAGRMFTVRLPDGHPYHAFEDELS